MSKPEVLAVCRKCYKAIGKKGGWKRASVMDQLERIAADADVELVMTGCLDVCPDRAVTYGLAASRKKDPPTTATIKPIRRDDPKSRADAVEQIL